MGLVEFELADQALELFGLVGEVACGLGGLGGAFGRLAGDRVDAFDGSRDLAGGCGLFVGGGGDVLDHALDALGSLDDAAQGFAGFGCQFDPVADAF